MQTVKINLAYCVYLRHHNFCTDVLYVNYLLHVSAFRPSLVIHIHCPHLPLATVTGEQCSQQNVHTHDGGNTWWIINVLCFCIEVVTAEIHTMVNTAQHDATLQCLN
jgi:hypothetical protein